MVAALMLLAGFVVLLGGGSARAQTDDSHPAHIHTGLCPTPGAVVFPLTNVSSAMAANGTPMATEGGAGAVGAIPVESSTTTVKTSLKDLLDGNHSIVVHESMANMGTYIVCGDIGGAVVNGTDLAIGLGELNNSGYSGVALLHDTGDGNVQVALYIQTTTTMRGAAESTPEAGAATPAAAHGVAIEIKGFAYNPASIDVPVGTTVTWTNNDTTAHTVTQDGGGFSSPTINPGETYSFTFDKAGTYTYHCEFHANMTGSITVK
jgi:plastocyanin